MTVFSEFLGESLLPKPIDLFVRIGEAFSRRIEDLKAAHQNLKIGQPLAVRPCNPINAAANAWKIVPDRTSKPNASACLSRT